MSRRGATRTSRCGPPTQASISDYFSPAQAGPLSLPSEHAIIHPAAARAESVQASLLSVGMRVRKAVPEGYKTTSEKGLTSTIPDTIQTGAAVRYSRAQELAPFCGIHRVGGYMEQLVVATYQSFDNEDFGFPSSSQESMASVESNETVSDVTQQSPRNLRKHFRDEGDEDDSGNMEHCGVGAARHIATAHTRRRGHEGTANFPRPPDDFEEASFLQPRSNEESDVEMDGW